MGKAVSDEDYMDTLFTSLPPSYDSTVSSISASTRLSTKTLTAEIFEQLILNKYERRKVKDKHDETKGEALTADTSKKTGKPSKGKDRRVMECYHCKKGSKDDAALAEDKGKLEVWAAVEEMEEPADEVQLEAIAAAVGRIPVQAMQSHSRASSQFWSVTPHVALS